MAKAKRRSDKQVFSGVALMLRAADALGPGGHLIVTRPDPNDPGPELIAKLTTDLAHARDLVERQGFDYATVVICVVGDHLEIDWPG